jgi:hypothetical protein
LVNGNAGLVGPHNGVHRARIAVVQEEAMNAPPNETRQPTPEKHLFLSPAPLARRGCAGRSAY